jgi:Ca2+-binding RTX toxin-like protein
MSASVVLGAKYSVILLAVLLLAGSANAATWNEIDGTRHADRIRGTAASDRLRGLEGNDVIRGRAADDRLVGGPGDDVLIGGPGQDIFICGGGEDVVVIDSSRVTGQMERFGNGCEAAILDSSHSHLG